MIGDSMSSAWARLITILLAAVPLLSSDLGQRILATNDEARFGVLAQDILARHDWLHPMLNGSAYSNKPPLQAWLIAAASWFRGDVTQLTAVVPSAVAALVATMIVWALGSELFGTDAARAAALAFITMQGVFLHARLPLPDMLMTALIGASLWMYVVALRRGGALRWASFYALVGAAFWAKGPAGLLPLLVVVVSALHRFGRGWWRQVWLPAGLPVLLLVVAPWYVMSFLADRAALDHAIVFDQVGWYAPSSLDFASVAGPLQNLVSALFPWILVLPFVIAQALRAARGRGAERDSVIFLLIWSLVTVLAVAISRHQRMRYYVPAALPVALLIGWWYAGAVVKRREQQPVRWSLYATLAAFLTVLTLVVSVARPRWQDEARLLLPGSAVEAACLLVALALMVGGLLFGVRWKRLAGGFAVAWMGAALLLGAGYHWALERRNAAYDYPRIYAVAEPHLHDVGELRVWGTPTLPLALYFQRPVVDLSVDKPLPPLPPGHALTMTVAKASLLEHSPVPGMVVVHRGPLGSTRVTIVMQSAPGSADPAR